MGFGGSADKISQPAPKPLGMDAKRTSTNEFGRVVPVWWGYARLAGTFISPEPWGVRADPVYSQSGKSRTVSGYNYTCSFAALFSAGLVDRIDAIYLDDSLAWEGPTSRTPGDDYVELTVEGSGTIRFYWGTETQTVDADLADSGVEHPGYRGQCYAVFIDWLLGNNKTNSPNIEILVRRYPQPDWLTSGPQLNDDINPVSMFGELWEDERFGMGLPTARLDLPVLNATAAALQSEQIGISPVLTDSSDYGKLMAMLMDHVNGFISTSNDGLFGFDLFRSTVATPPAITTADLLDVPELGDSTGYADCINQAFVTFANRNLYFQNDSVSWVDDGAFAITSRNKSQSFNRPWVTKQHVAWAMAASLCRQAAVPRIGGSIMVARAVGQSLAPGAVFTLTHAKSHLSAVRCRVISRTLGPPASSDVTLGFIEDQSHLNVLVSDVAEDAAATAQTYEATALFDQTGFELPYAYAASRSVKWALAPVRGDLISNGFNVHWQKADFSYSQIGVGQIFALKAYLGTAFPLTVLLEDPYVTLDLYFTGPDSLLRQVTYEEALNRGPMRIFIGSEIMLGYEPTLVGADHWTVKVLRARYGSAREAHAEEAEVWVFQPSSEEPIYVDTEPNTPAAQTFKLQPFVLANQLDMADCPALTLTNQRRAWRTPPPANLRAFGDGVNPTYTTGQDIVMTWDETSEEASLFEPEVALTCRADTTLLQILTTLDVLCGTIEVTGSAGPYSIDNGDLVALLGSEVSFKVRATYRVDGLESLTYSELTVWKI